MVSIVKIKNFFTRASRVPWIVGQRLVRVPKNVNSSVSDLFIWACDDNWNTFFDLIDIYSLFEDEPGHIFVHIYDKNGLLLTKDHIQLDVHNKTKLDISTLLPEKSGNYGTFCIFHSRSPGSFVQHSSFIAERGYTGYKYKSSTLLAYVHGNHDAIAFNRMDKTTELLGSSSIFKRKYNLQYLLEYGHKYYLGVVNNSPVDQQIKLSVLNSKDSSIVMYYNEFNLKPKGVNFSKVELKKGQQGRASISSKLIMSRPVVFRIGGNNMDIFHG
jgi:hypothetical protein